MLCLNVFNAYVYNYVDTFYVQMNYTSTSQVFIHSWSSSTHSLKTHFCVVAPPYP